LAINELHSLGHEAADEMRSAAQPVELCDHDGGPASTGLGERGSELRATVELVG
jgi:hypothetical protein